MTIVKYISHIQTKENLLDKLNMFCRDASFCLTCSKKHDCSPVNKLTIHMLRPDIG